MSLLKPLAVGVAALGAVASSVAIGVQQQNGLASDGRPNFVIVQTDDQLVTDLQTMPNVRRLLGAGGMTFNNMRTPQALCCPARATMMTGSYPHNTGVRSNFPPTGGYGPWSKQAHLSAPAWLKDAGYHTVHLGKYINGYGMWNRRAALPIGWSDGWFSADPSTYQMYGFRVNHAGSPKRYGVFEVENPKNYNTNVFTGIAAGVVRTEAARPGPFYMQVAYLAPHVETVPMSRSLAPKNGPPDDDSSETVQNIPPRPAPRDRNAFKNLPLKRDPSFNEADVSDKGMFVRDMAPMTDEQIQELVEDNRQRRRSLLSVDRGVAEIVSALKATGQYDNTVFVFMGDNGYLLGQHRFVKGKYFPYEPALRIPFVIAGPGVQKGVETGAFVSETDVAPTVLDFAGVTPTGRTPDGISLKGFLQGTSRLPDRAMLLESGPQQSPKGAPLPLFDGIHTKRYAWWRYEDGSEELYDLVRDRWQMESKASDPAYADTRAALIALWEKMKACVGTECQADPGPIPGPVLAGLNLKGKNLQGKYLANADLSGANLVGAQLQGADLHGANLSGAKLIRANLTGANLTGANLTTAFLDGSKDVNANFTGANLSKAHMTRADLTGATLTGANTTGTYWAQTTCPSGTTATLPAVCS